MINVEPYLDSANKELWQTMSQRFNISVEYGSEDCYGNYHKNNDCVIYVPQNSVPNQVSFTHELLHLYLPYHGIFIGGAIECTLKGQYPLNIVFNDKLYDHISNSLEHIKMLPLYLNMGYPKEYFLSDYFDCKLTNSEINSIRKSYKTGLLFPKYNSLIINFYIGKFFAAKADINSDNHYDQQLTDLYNIDHVLYSALEKFWNSWLDYDVTIEPTALGCNYNDMVNLFVDDLIDWSKKKKIV